MQFEIVIIDRYAYLYDIASGHKYLVVDVKLTNKNCYDGIVHGKSGRVKRTVSISNIRNFNVLINSHPEFFL